MKTQHVFLIGLSSAARKQVIIVYWALVAGNSFQGRVEFINAKKWNISIPLGDINTSFFFLPFWVKSIIYIIWLSLFLQQPRENDGNDISSHLSIYLSRCKLWFLCLLSHRLTRHHTNYVRSVTYRVKILEQIASTQGDICRRSGAAMGLPGCRFFK